MGWFTKVDVVAEAVPKTINAVGDAFDKLFTSDEERDQAKIVMQKLKDQPHVLQGELNKIEASHRSIFIAGWRPAVGWVCAIGLGFIFLGNPLIQWATCAFGEVCMTGPAIPTDALLELTLAMLGLGGLRTFEKLKGITK